MPELGISTSWWSNRKLYLRLCPILQDPVAALGSPLDPSDKDRRGWVGVDSVGLVETAVMMDVAFQTLHPAGITCFSLVFSSVLLRDSKHSTLAIPSPCVGHRSVRSLTVAGLCKNLLGLKATWSKAARQEVWDNLGGSARTRTPGSHRGQNSSILSLEDNKSVSTVLGRIITEDYCTQPP